MLYVNFSHKPLKVATKLDNSYFQPILAGIFVTIATVKVEVIRDFYTLVIVQISKQQQIDDFLLYFSLMGGQNSLLMHVPL